MSDHVTSHSPFERLLKPGAYPSTTGETGLSIHERRDVTLLQLVARKTHGTQLDDLLTKFLGRKRTLGPLEAATRGDILICATSPREYWILESGQSASKIMSDLKKTVAQSASIFDQSDARIVLRLAGLNAMDVLAKGCVLDLHEQVFPSPGASHTIIEHIPALVVRHNAPAVYDVMIPRSYAASFITWIREAARDYGYVIQAPHNILEI